MNAHAGKSLWLFDLGNTSLKARWSCAGETGQSLVIDWESTQLQRQLVDALAGWPEPAQVLVAAVAAAERAEQVRAVLRRWPDTRVEWLVSPRRGCGITNPYRAPARLGIDRFLAMAGARSASHAGAFVVVGCGTALTLDAVDAQGRQRDGLIAPSPDLMMRSLQAHTAIGHTNPDAFDDSSDATDDTAAAIHAGCWRAAVGLIETSHARQRAAFGEIPLWLHGGAAQALKTALDQSGVVHAALLEDAIWRGMQVWAAAPP